MKKYKSRGGTSPNYKHHVKYYNKNRQKVLDRSKEWFLKNREKIRKAAKDRYKKNRVKILEKTYTLESRIRRKELEAKNRGLEFALDIEWANKRPMRCYYTGLELTLRPNKFNTLSFDRRNSKLGYTKHNTVFCCNYINKAKLDLTIKEFKRMIRLLYKSLNNF